MSDDSHVEFVLDELDGLRTTARAAFGGRGGSR